MQLTFCSMFHSGKHKIFILFFLLPILLPTSVFAQYKPIALQDKRASDLKVGAERMEVYLPLVKNKNIAVVAHPASMVRNTHLVDTLLKAKVKLKKIFAPEHGFRGDVEAGGKINTGVDKKTGLTVVSLYGKNNKPKAED